MNSECDRSFTRSDALAKHMRTVHETEALRPSDPVPKSHGGGSMSVGAASLTTPTFNINKGSGNSSSNNTRLKLLLSTQSSGDHALTNGTDADQEYDVDAEDNDNDADAELDPLERPERDDSTSRTPVNQAGGVTAAAAAGGTAPATTLTVDPSLPPSQQFRVLRRQVDWAEQEQRALRQQCEALEERRHREWLAKELLLNNVLEAEIRYQGKRRGKVPEQSKVEVLPEKELPMRGAFTPWYRQDSEEESG